MMMPELSLSCLMALPWLVQGFSKRESIPSVEPADLYQVPFYTRYIEMMEYKSLGAVSLPNFKHMGEDEKKKNKKVTECMFTTVLVGCMYIMYLT